MENSRMIDKKIGGRVSSFRKQARLTQEMLAEKVGCATVSISKLEIGSARASVKMLAKIAETLSIPLMELFRFDDVTEKERKIKGMVLLMRDESGRLIEKSYSVVEKHK